MNTRLSANNGRTPPSRSHRNPSSGGRSGRCLPRHGGAQERKSSEPVERGRLIEQLRQALDEVKKLSGLLRARGYAVSSEEPADRFVPVLDLVHHGPCFVFNGEKRPGIAVPLFNLVYHDSILLPWSMDDAGGWGIPEGDAGYLHAFLNAGLPYVAPGRPYGKDPAADAALAKVREAAQLAQRAAFADGTRVTVDFAAKTHSIDYPR